MSSDLPPERGRGDRNSRFGDTESSKDTLAFETLIPEISGYRVIGLLGKGGMGLVYLAEDEALGRNVAIKIISDSLPDRDQVVARFRREARSMAAVTHPSIVQVYSLGEAGDRPYIVMQYIEGKSLAEKISKSGPMTVSESVRVVHQINDALEAAWQQKIVHRDLKPANILLDSQSNIHVADFGLARAVLADQGSTVTQTGQLLGTPTYLAPEQARGEDVDFRVDIYSLGILFFEMLTGAPPYEATTPLAVVAKHLQDPLPPINTRNSEIPAEIERTIRWMVSKEPRSRPGSHDELRQRLLHAAPDEISVRRPTGVGKVSASLYKETADKSSRPDFTPPRPLSRESLKETERRQATVFNGEISAFSDLADAVDDETAAVVASETLNILTQGIERSGGTLIEASPSKVTAVFGFPTAFENSPREAVNAAIGIRKSLRKYRRERGLPVDLRVRIGISTGLLIASGINQDGDVRYTIMGEAADEASSFRNLAEDEQILVGRITKRNTSGDFEFGSERSMSPRKGGESLQAIELVSDREKVYRTPISSDRLLSSSLVGRAGEIDRLELRILKLLNGEGSIVNVVGPAGIGKSRITAELRSLNSTKKLAFLEGRSVAMGETLGFHPIIDLLKNWAQIGEQDSNTDAVHKLYSAITRVDPDGRDEVFPFVATVMGLRLTGSHADRVQGIEGDNLRQLIIKNLRDLIITASMAQPLVFILEDLHWADQTSIEFLESLYRVVIDHHILFVNVFRPGYHETSGRIAEHVSEAFPGVFEEITLEPLKSKDCEQLVANMFGTRTLPGRLKRMIVEKTDGNPFFVEEVGRSFIEEGAVVLDKGQVKISDSIDSVQVPETIQDVLLARVDRLDDETRSLIRVAAVIGRRFFYRVVKAVAGNIENLDERLQYLEQLKMIRQVEAGDEVQFSFKHALTQEVVYDSILGNQRRQLHFEIAQTIESLLSDRLHEFYGMLAFHYCSAEELEKAEEFLIKAGSEALKSAASSEALNSYRHALNLYSERSGAEVDARKIALLEKNIAVALYNHGQYAEAVKSARRVLPYFNIRTPTGDVDLGFRSLTGFTSFLFAIHFPGLRFNRDPNQDDSEGIRLYYQCLAALVHHNPKRFLLESFILARRLSKFDLAKIENGVSMFASSGNLLAWTGASFYLSKKVLKLLDDRFDVSDVKAEVSLNAAQITHAFLAGEWKEASSYNEDLIDRALGVGEIFLTSNYVIFHGRLALEQGKIEHSQKLADQLNEIGQQYSHDYPPALHVYLHSKILLKTRELDSAITECTEGEQVAGEASLDIVVFSLGAFKARILAIKGDLEEADRLLCQVEESVKKRQLPRSYRGDILLSRCTVDVLLMKDAWQSGDLKHVSKIKKRTSHSCQRLLRNSRKVASHRVEAARLTGMYHLFSGENRKALRQWETGLQIGKQLGADLDLARLYTEIGRWTADPKIRVGQLNGRSGESFLLEAESLFKKMQIDWDLAELADIKF